MEFFLCDLRVLCGLRLQPVTNKKYLNHEGHKEHEGGESGYRTLRMQ